MPTNSSENRVKLLGVEIDNTLKFELHIKELCKKVNQKVHAIGRLKGLLTFVLTLHYFTELYVLSSEMQIISNNVKSKKVKRNFKAIPRGTKIKVNF